LYVLDPSTGRGISSRAPRSFSRADDARRGSRTHPIVAGIGGRVEVAPEMGSWAAEIRATLSSLPGCCATFGCRQARVARCEEVGRAIVQRGTWT
jgi:hypothetical protein